MLGDKDEHLAGWGTSRMGPGSTTGDPSSALRRAPTPPRGRGGSGSRSTKSSDPAHAHRAAGLGASSTGQQPETTGTRAHTRPASGVNADGADTLLAVI